MHCISYNSGRYIQNENKERKQRKQENVCRLGTKIQRGYIPGLKSS